MAWVIEKLASHHDRAGFDSGQALLDNFLKNLAGQHARRDVGQTYVAVEPGDPRVIGYFTIATSAIEFEKLPSPLGKGLPRTNVPVVLLGRLAVDRPLQGQGLGKFLLFKALRKIVMLASEVGIRAVEVHAIDDAAKSFYLKYGFVPLVDHERHLFLPMGYLRRVMGEADEA
jgi:GNAT superfamily N-acetyltransferase